MTSPRHQKPKKRGYRPKLIETVFMDFISERTLPFLSPSPKVKVLSKTWLSDDLLALRLLPNRAWRRQYQQIYEPVKTNESNKSHWQTGQHILLSVTIDGVCLHRSYSLVGLPEWDVLAEDETFGEAKPQHEQDMVLTIAIKRQGRVSNHLAVAVQAGDVLDCGLPSGQFTLRQHEVTADEPVAFVCAGSGVTPILGLVTDALQTGSPERPVTLLYYAKTPVFMTQWQTLQRQYPNFRCHIVATTFAGSYILGKRHLDKAVLDEVGISLQHKIYACGATPMLSSLTMALSEQAMEAGQDINAPNPLDNLILERFGRVGLTDAQLANVNLATEDEENIAINEHATVLLARRGVSFHVVNATPSILLGAERAQIYLPYGCRQGMCQICRCDKQSGIVKNLLTGEVSDDGAESIRICVSAPVTDVVLDV